MRVSAAICSIALSCAATGNALLPKTPATTRFIDFLPAGTLLQLHVRDGSYAIHILDKSSIVEYKANVATFERNLQEQRRVLEAIEDKSSRDYRLAAQRLSELSYPHFSTVWRVHAIGSDFITVKPAVELPPSARISQSAWIIIPQWSIRDVSPQSDEAEPAVPKPIAGKEDVLGRIPVEELTFGEKR